ncbi:unnamed protein product, partial [Urochloa humidicola]
GGVPRLGRDLRAAALGGATSPPPLPPLHPRLRRRLPSLAAWRRLLRPGMPPLLLNPRSRRVDAFSHSRLVLARPLAYHANLPAEGAILLSASRGRLLL